MRVTRIEVLAGESSCRLQALVESDLDPDEPDWFEPFPLWYRFPAWCQPFLSVDNGDPFLAALLVPAMRNGEPLAISAPVSAKLLRALPQLKEIYAAFDPHHARIPIAAVARQTPLPAAAEPRVGLFFSLGVDSFYSLLKNVRDQPTGEDAVTHLLPVQGFDLADPQDEGIGELVHANLERVAAETGKALVPVSTNIRRVGEHLALWSMMHGAAMASIALALGAAFSRVLVAASARYDNLYPWGTHPLLDPLWSTETLTIIHDGCERDTIEKTLLVGQHELVLDTLRVCPGFGTAYNCGVCLKCLRTAIDLAQQGRLGRSRTLPRQIDPERLRVAIRDGNGPVHLAAFRQRLAIAEATGIPPGVAPVIAAYLAEQSGHQPLAPPRRKGSFRRRLRRWLS